MRYTRKYKRIVAIAALSGPGNIKGFSKYPCNYVFGEVSLRKVDSKYVNTRQKLDNVIFLPTRTE